MDSVLEEVPPLPPEALSDLERILRLDRSPVLNCETGPNRWWAPEAEALIAVETAKYMMGPRISCGCRDREVARKTTSLLEVWQEAPPTQVPDLPFTVSTEAFLGDLDPHYEGEILAAVRGLRVGQSVKIPGIGRPCIKEFNPVQAWELRELPKVGGVFGHLPIGSGKTLAGIISAIAVPGVRLAVLLGKPGQRHHYVLAYRQAREHFRVPSLVIDAPGVQERFISPGQPVLHFVPYTVVQQQKQRLLLEQLDPDMILADEAHCLSAAPSKKRGPGSARAGRVLRYMAKRNAEGRPVIFACWSGSLVNKTLLDMTHLAAFSLGLGSPYPIDPDVQALWSDVVDINTRFPDTTSSPAIALRQALGKRLRGPAFLAASDSSVREGLQKWAVETPGVISAKSSSINCSIAIFERETPKMPEEVKAALKKVREGERPDGDVIEEKVEQIAIGKNVGCGFFNYWAFPGIRCGCPPEAPLSCEGCVRIENWYARRKMYAREARAKQIFGETHLDTPGLLKNAAKRAYQEPRYDGDLPVWPSEHWPAWAAIEHTVPHVNRVKWISDFFVDDAVAWAKEHRGIIYFESVPLGRRIAEKAKISYFGENSEAALMAVDGKTSIVVSQSAHGESFDGLQYKYHEAYTLESPASGKAWDQKLGRLAREGQKEDTVNWWVARHSEELRDAFAKAYSFAEYDEEMSPIDSLLRCADLDFKV